MILIDYEGEILLDIAEVAAAFCMPTLAAMMAERGHEPATIVEAVNRAASVLGRDPVFQEEDFQ